jgi:hypothetical protein
VSLAPPEMLAVLSSGVVGTAVHLPVNPDSTRAGVATAADGYVAVVGRCCGRPTMNAVTMSATMRTALELLDEQRLDELWSVVWKAAEKPFVVRTGNGVLLDRRHAIVVARKR